MRRVSAIVGLALGLTVWLDGMTNISSAQEPGRMYRLGILFRTQQGLGLIREVTWSRRSATARASAKRRNSAARPPVKPSTASPLACELAQGGRSDAHRKHDEQRPRSALQVPD
jgi:hypothetical protein